MRNLITLLALAVVAAALLLGYRWISRPVVEVYVVQRGSAIAAVYGTVKVTPSARVQVRAQDSGLVRLARHAAEAELAAGMEVTEGQVLAEIVDSELDHELAKAEAELKAAAERAQLGPSSRPWLDTAVANLAQREKLAEWGAITQNDLDRVRREVQGLRERVTTERVELDRSLAVLREQVDALRDRRGRREIKAPLGGLLSQIPVATGESVLANTTLFTISSRTLYLEGQVNEEDVGVLRPKMKAVVRLYAFPQQEFATTLARILPGGDNQRYTVRLEFDAPPDNLMADMTGEMNIVVNQRANVLVIPTRALQANRVWVVDQGVAKPRTVRTGLHSLELTEIVAGLQEQEQVIVADFDLFRAGQRVRALSVNR